MKKIFLAAALLCLGGMNIKAQTPRDACTSIMVGKKASVDGSVMTSHTCDSWYRTWMSIEPAKDYPRDTIIGLFNRRYWRSV